MADADIPSSGELFELMTQGNKNRQAVEEAIQKGLQSFVETADAEINKLVQANTLGPDVTKEMEDLQKTFIQQTTDMIKNGPLGKAGSEE